MCEDECSVCHMPITRYEAKIHGEKGEVFALPAVSRQECRAAKAEDGVTCSVCHQISKDKLGTRESFNGEFVINPPDTKNERPEYGPFVIDAGHQLIMQSSTGGFRPTCSGPHSRLGALRLVSSALHHRAR